MNFLILAFRRRMRTVWFPVLLVLLSLGIASASFLGEQSGFPVAGIADADGSALSQSVVKTLADAGFKVCATEDELRGGIGRGELDCGVLLPEGFGEKIHSGSPDQAALFLETPDSFVPQLWRDQAAAEIFRERAPYLAAALLAEADIPADGIFAEYDGMTADGSLFAFEIEVVDSFDAPADTRALRYAMGIAVLLGFPTVLFAVCRVFDERETANRLGSRRATSALILPGLAAILLPTFAACLIGCGLLALRHSPVGGELILPLAEWVCLTTAFSVAAEAVLRRREWVHGLAFFVLLLTPVLCPLAWDAGLLFPPVRVLRCVLPTYWLWMCEADPALGGILAALSLPLTVLLAGVTAARMTGKRK